MKTFIHPSILSADFAKLGEELQRIPDADAVHVEAERGDARLAGLALEAVVWVVAMIALPLVWPL